MNRSTVIIGGGISGLAALHYLKFNAPDLKITLYESASQPGGVIGTDIIDGYACEWGPSGILDREGLCRQISEDLGIEESLESASKDARNRYVVRNGQLCPIPLTPAALFSSRILSLRGKLRLFGELFTSPGAAQDESIYDFFTRHIGQEATDYMIQPMVTGIFAGRAEQLSIKACFPRFHELDREYGSLIKGMIKSQFQKRNSNSKPKKKKGTNRLLSFKQKGVGVLVDALTKRYSSFIQTDRPVKSIRKLDASGSNSHRWLIRFHDNSTDKAENIVLAVPAHQATLITQSYAARLSELLGSISYAPLVVICLGYPLMSITRPLDGFGFLIPPKESRKILGAIWATSIFTRRAPDEKVQLRVLIGGSDAANTNLPSLSDDELLSLVRDDIRDLMGITDSPEMVKIYRHIRAIPEYKLGHPKLLTQIEMEVARTPGLYLAGNSYFGVGVSDCLKTSLNIAGDIMS